MPDTRLTTNDTQTIGDKLASGDIKTVLKSISKLLSVPVSHYVIIDEKKIPLLIDLMEGINFFIWQPDVLEKEKLPVGEFLMDGAVVRSYLNLSNNNEYSNLIRLQRYYNLLLNTWNLKGIKWNILKNKYIFEIITKHVTTNIISPDLYTLGESLFVSKKHWIPFFWEIPVKKEESSLFLNQEATVFYLRKFMEKINSAKNFYLEETPNMEIKNGTAIPNLAKKIREEYSRRGFKILEFSNADKNDYQNTILLDQSGNNFYLETAMNSLQINRSYHAVNKSNFTDIILILGKDYKTILNNIKDDIQE